MEFVLRELERALNYNQRQLEENVDKIKRNLETNKLLEEKNAEHWEAIGEIKAAIIKIKG